MKIDLQAIKRMNKKQRKEFVLHLSSLELLQVTQAIKAEQAQSIHFCEYERNIFAKCKGARMRKRVKNNVSREEMGTCPQITYAVRTGVHSVCVCKGWANR